MPPLVFVVALIALICVPAAAEEAKMAPGPQIESGDRVLGNVNAPITVYEYTSYLCTDCREYRWQPHFQILSSLVDTRKIRIVHRDFPLSELAFNAALVARCVPPENYDRIVSELFWFQHVWSAMKDPMEGLSSIALAYGVPREETPNCLNDQDVIDHVADTFATGQALFGIQTLPTFFFVKGGSVVRAEGVLTLKDFEEIIDNI